CSRSLSSSGIIFSRGGRTPPSQNKRKPGEGYRYCGAVVTNGAIVIHTQRLKSDPGGNLLS
ncbi:hypothetical protein R1D69_26340, partial [Escherichia coli]|uniref:hypothetical protein n=1 Tax=Escherichia coli TaxID=562 RepID=UPI0024499679